MGIKYNHICSKCNKSCFLDYYDREFTLCLDCQREEARSKVLLPMVHKKSGLELFDNSKIYYSLLKETRLTEEQAKEVCEATTRRIISHNIQFLSGPHIREIVNSVLAEKGYIDARKRYTRIGMPFYDLHQLLEGIVVLEEDKYGVILQRILREYEVVKELIEEANHDD